MNYSEMSLKELVALMTDEEREKLSQCIKEDFLQYLISFATRRDAETAGRILAQEGHLSHLLPGEISR